MLFRGGRLNSLMLLYPVNRTCASLLRLSHTLASHAFDLIFVMKLLTT